MNDTFKRVLDYWKTNNVSLVSPLDAVTVRDKFNQAKLVVAEDFVEFHSIVGGMNSFYVDPNQWSCWNIERIVEENRSYPRPGIMFGDWCINSLLHVVRCESEKISSVWVDDFSDQTPFKVADSLTEFCELYLARDTNIFIL